jgi:hypothetical protein
MAFQDIMDYILPPNNDIHAGITKSGSMNVFCQHRKNRKPPTPSLHLGVRQKGLGSN